MSRQIEVHDVPIKVSDRLENLAYKTPLYRYYKNRGGHGYMMESSAFKDAVILAVTGDTFCPYVSSYGKQRCKKFAEQLKIDCEKYE